ncbi:MAG TPA: glycosyltransferase family 4 protein [Rhodocyclaceae bacterium]|nr:glycosyltransferase family 4 protein [Rhodocyclaceae bacterium]
MPIGDPRTIAFVVPRYGRDITGGAETLCRNVAENLAAAGLPIEVYTTCAVDHFTWENHHPAGVTLEGGVPVHRFPVTAARDRTRFEELHHGIVGIGDPGYDAQLEWMAHSVWSADLDAALAARNNLRCRIALPYLFGTTFWSVVDDPARTILVPCLHDEPYAYLRVVREMLQAAAGCLANARGEADLIERIAPAARVALGGVGFTPGEGPTDPMDFCTERRIAPGYLLYAGRREEAKGVLNLYRDYARFVRMHPDAPPLAMMGSGQLDPPAEIADRVIDLGFVPARRMRDAFAAAAVLLHPSRLESFGMVLLEAWLEGVPALVNGSSPVLTAHCQESGGGLWYDTPAEFVEGLDILLGDDGLRRRMGAAGRHYVVSEHSWARVRDRWIGAIDAWV